jgi:hypothetical protein
MAAPDFLLGMLRGVTNACAIKNLRQAYLALNLIDLAALYC